MQVSVTGGTSSFVPAASPWQTSFANQTASIPPAGGILLTLYTQTPLGTTYLGGVAPTVTVAQISGGYQITNTYADLNHTQLTQTVLHFDDNNNPASAGNTGGLASLDYLAQVVGTKDDITSNQFTYGTMTTLASENIRILSGVDSVLNNTDANNLLAGQAPTGIPTGLFTR